MQAASCCAYGATDEVPVPGIQRSTPVFHAHAIAEMNTIKKKKRKPFPWSRLVLYSVASEESAFSAIYVLAKTRVGSCRVKKQ